MVKHLTKDEIWILLNLFKNITGVTVSLPVLGKFIKNSYIPIAIAVGRCLNSDIVKFYTKIHKYITALCGKI